MGLRDLEKGHAERTYFHPGDFKAIFGEVTTLWNPCLTYPLLDETQVDEWEARQLVPELGKRIPYNPGSLGLMAVVYKTPGAKRFPKVSDAVLIDGIFDFRAELPNKSRLVEVVEPTWIKLQVPQPGKIEGKEWYSPLSKRWYGKNLQHIKYFLALQKITPEQRFSRKMLYSLVLLFAAFLRFILTPGDIRGKLLWALKMLNGRILTKLLGR
ncbi:hypothetical protein K8I28_00725 [bacterium]|nr:hypothetical protein [bacterium]